MRYARSGVNGCWNRQGEQMFPWNAVITGAVAIVTLMVSLIYQTVRAWVDNRNQLVRDQAQRAFEFRRARFERNYDACVQVAAHLYDFGPLLRKYRAASARIEDMRQSNERLSEQAHPLSADEKARMRHDLDQLEREVDEINAEIDAFYAQTNTALSILQLDYTAVDLIAPYQAFVAACQSGAEGEALKIAYQTCIAEMFGFLRAEALELQTPPPQWKALKLSRLS